MAFTEDYPGRSRSVRIRTGGEFARIREEGVRLTKGCLVANWITLPPDSDFRIGIITTRRLGGAVIRNRARRLIRETFRLNQCRLKQPVAMVLVARKSIVGKKQKDVEHDFLRLMRRGKLLKENV